MLSEGNYLAAQLLLCQSDIKIITIITIIIMEIISVFSVPKTFKILRT